jgi:hypothetical protein
MAMPSNELITHLQAWMERHQAMVAMLDKLYDITQANPGSPLLAEIYGLMDSHTKAVARIVGDTAGWLDWFAYECDFGRRPHEAALKGEKLTTIRTIKQLARLIEEGTA